MSDTTWTLHAGGDFNTASDWSEGVPTGDDLAYVTGTYDQPITVTVGSADVIAPFTLLSLFDATLAVAGGTITVGTLVTSDDTLSGPLSELVVGNSTGTTVHVGLLTIQGVSTIGSYTNSQVNGLTQTAGLVDFQNGSLESAVSYVEGGQGGVQQSGGTIEVDYGTLDIYGNSSFAGTLASSGGTAAAGTTGVVRLGGGWTYSFNSGVVLDVHEVELQDPNTTLNVNKSLVDQYLFNQGSSTTIDLNSTSLTLELATTLGAGAIDLLGGTIENSGTVVNLGTIDDSNMTLAGSVQFQNNAASTVHQNSGIVIGVQVGSATTLDNQANANYVIDTSGPYVMTGTGLFANYGLFATSTQTPAGALSTISAQFSNETTGTVLVTAGTLDFANNDNFAGTLAGSGMVEISGSGSNTLDAGVALTSSAFYVSGAGGGGALQVNILGSLAYAGDFLQDAGTTIQLLPGTVSGKTVAPLLTLTNTGDVSGVVGGTIIGGNTALLVLDATTNAPLSDNGMIIRGAMTVEDTGTVSQEGYVTIGLLSGDFETQLLIGPAAPTAVYEFVAPSLITGVGTITNMATFEQGPEITGTSLVSAFFTSSATVLCKSGTLEFTGSDTFAGTITGNGVVELSGAGASFTLTSNLLVTVSTLEISDVSGSPQVDLLGSLTYNNSFVQTGATVLSIEGAPAANGSYANQPTLTLNGMSSILDGTIAGLAPYGVTPSELLVSKTGSASANGMVLTGAVTLLDQGQISQQGAVVVGPLAGDLHTLLEVAVGATYNLTAVSNISGDGGIINLGTFVQAISVTGNSYIGTQLVSADTVQGTTIETTPTIASEGGVLEFTGSDTFSGTITGTGTVALSAASFTFTPLLTSITVAALEITDNVAIGADVTILGTLVDYARFFDQTVATTLSLGSTASQQTTFELTGASDIEDGTIDGLGGATSSQVLWTGVNGTDTGMTLTGNVTLTDVGSIGQSSSVVIGANAGDIADLVQINAGALYDLSEVSTISGVGAIVNLGTFEQGVSVTTTSVVSVAFVSDSASSVVLIADGTLEFTGPTIIAGKVEITGSGGVLEFNGDTGTISTSTVLTTNGLVLNDTLGGTDVTIQATGTAATDTLTYAGVVNELAGTTIAIGASATLVLTNSEGQIALDGMVGGFGELVWAKGSQGADAGLGVTNSATMVDDGFIGQVSVVTIGVLGSDDAELSIGTTGTYAFRGIATLTGDGTVVNAGIFGQGTGPSTTNFVSVASFDSTGIVDCGGGVIEFSGNDTFGGTATTAGTMEGGGLIEMSAGTFNFIGVNAAGKGGLTLNIGTLDLAANLGVAQLNVSGKVNYAGSFTEAAGNTISLEAAAVLTLSGGSDLLNGALIGAAGSQLWFDQSLGATDDGMTVTGALKLIDAGEVFQAGVVNLGVSAGDAGVSLTIKPAGVYTLDNYAAINGYGSIINDGNLVKAGTVLGGGTSTIAPNVTNATAANVAVGTGELIFNAVMLNNGTVSATNGGTAEFGAAVALTKGDTGTIEVGSTGMAIFANGVVAGQTVVFEDNSGRIVINNPSVFNATISGFQAAGGQSDSIDLTTVSKTGLTATYAPTTTANTSGILTLTETVGTVVTTVAQLHFAGTYTLPNFAFGVDSSGLGTLVTDPPAAAAPITTENTATSAVAFTNIGSATETAVLLPAGNGVEQVLGFQSNGQDVLDLQKVLAGAAGHPNLIDIGNYVTASITGDDTTLSYDPTGHGGGSAFAVLVGVNTSMNSLLAQHALTLH